MKNNTNQALLVTSDSRDTKYMWDLFYLALCWAWTLTTSTLLTTVGPYSATSLGASDAIAPFTIGVFLVGAAVSSVPSGLIFRKYGRKRGFEIGCYCQLVSFNDFEPPS
jgi:MFS family permease